MDSYIDTFFEQEGNSQVTSAGIGECLRMITQNICDLTMEAKEDMTPEELRAETHVLEHPINWTDPIVWHDPTIDTGVIIKMLSTDKNEYSPVNNTQTSHSIDAIYFPLIKINQRILANDEIIYMKLESTEILPKLHLRVIDKHGSMTKTNSTGLNNSIILVITAPINGVYKKIKLQFYITDVKSYPSGDDFILKFTAINKIPKLMHKFPTSMNYPEKNQFSGCEKCKQAENTKPNSWEMLHYIANYCGMGFASTKKCKDISDRSYRLFNAYNNLEECLYKEKEFAGTDEDTAIFDWWVDFYNYLVMVNVPYIMNEDITIRHLGMYGIALPKVTTDVNKLPEPAPILINRTLSNSRRLFTSAATHNIMIRNYKVITDNSLYTNGTCTTNNVFIPKGAGGENIIDRFDVQTQEMSVAGKEFEKYTTNQTYIRGIDMSGFNKYKKATIFSKFFQKKRSKILVVELEQYNLAIQRGTLVNIVIMETDPKVKSIIMNNTENLISDYSEQNRDNSNTGNIEENNDQQDLKPLDKITNETEVINYSLTGLYYVDGITFEYDYTLGQRIFQKIYLIRKGPLMNYMAPNAPLNINTSK